MVLSAVEPGRTCSRKRLRFTSAVSDASVIDSKAQKEDKRNSTRTGFWKHVPELLWLARFRVFLFVLGERVKLGEPGLIPFVPFVGVNRHQAVPGHCPCFVIGSLWFPAFEVFQDVNTRANLAAPVAFGLHGFVVVFINSFGFQLRGVLV